MLRSIYHGSDRIVRSPGFGTGSSGNDYGLGFYCTESRDLAAEWAVGVRSNGFVNCYSIETEGLRIINLNSPEYCILHWLAILLNYRDFDAGSSEVYRAKDYIRTTFSVDYQSCDCIIGFRADDSNFSFAQDFLDGVISYRQFNDAVRLSDTGRQFVLKSNRAFDRIIFTGYDIAWSRDSYPAKAARDRNARLKMSGMLQGTAPAGSAPPAVQSASRSKKAAELYISQIVSSGIMPYDPVLT